MLQLYYMIQYLANTTIIYYVCIWTDATLRWDKVWSQLHNQITELIIRTATLYQLIKLHSINNNWLMSMVGYSIRNDVH